MAGETVQRDEAAILADPRRRQVAIEAGIQVNALADGLAVAARQACANGTEAFDDLVLAIMPRIRALASVVIAASSDSDETIDALEWRLNHG